ncbi:MAG: DUF2511 domain-containing protein [Aeromicrobium sp.]|uniref:DUF2511 domain-containing protein n=1 Tax=Aeromicrobium sp. TaxID=1871063 RepID=UPI002624D6DE|nr:DUF2511 domain-containing protein [Aeromicrobium sp.]MDF1705826.1 DUF2511 domain-containing protein [Aeromicrobium sp.]
MRPSLTSAVLVVALAGLTGCDSDAESASTSDKLSENPYGVEVDPGTLTADVTQDQFGEDWPLTVTSGLIICNKMASSTAVIFRADGSDQGYALNGVAKGGNNMETFDLIDVDPIWADDPATGAKKDIGVLIDVCKNYL